MKTLYQRTVVLLFLISIPLFSFGQENPVLSRVLLGVDPNGTLGVSTSLSSGGSQSKDWDTKAGLSFGGEFLFGINPHWQLGAGGLFGLDRNLKDATSVGFSFIQCYAATRVLIPMETLTPYLVGRLGFSTFKLTIKDSSYTPSSDGGVQYGVGAGVEYPITMSNGTPLALFAEGSFAFNPGNIKANYTSTVTYTETYEYTRLQLLVGLSVLLGPRS